jgi:hypothetical protein
VIQPAIKARFTVVGSPEDSPEERLTRLYVKHYGGMLRAVHGLLTRALNRDEQPLDDVSMRHFVLEARARAVRVEAATQFAISAMIADGVRRGLTREEIANGTADFPGIEGLFTETWKNRGLTIARTELQHAMVQAAADRFQANRDVIVGMIAHDGDTDEACAARDGRRYELNNPPSLAHPGCRLTIEPVLAAPVVQSEPVEAISA